MAAFVEDGYVEDGYGHVCVEDGYGHVCHMMWNF